MGRFKNRSAWKDMVKFIFPHDPFNWKWYKKKRFER
jgi:hypothetical protein